MGTSVPGPSNPVKGVYVTLHETDVDKVRKIKKIIKAIKKGEELSQGLLDKIKSQGVSEMDDSAMIMRVKFVCVPGEQFVLRREVYRRIQEAFRKNGIEFAYRNVTVYFPPESTSGSDPQPSENMTEPEPQDQKKERGCCSCNNESHLRKKNRLWNRSIIFLLFEK